MILTVLYVLMDGIGIRTLTTAIYVMLSVIYASRMLLSLALPVHQAITWIILRIHVKDVLKAAQGALDLK